MRDVEYIMSRIFGLRDYIDHVRMVGARQVETPYNDLTESQAILFDICVSDPEMYVLVKKVFGRYEELKIEHNLSAKPWLDES